MPDTTLLNMTMSIEELADMLQHHSGGYMLILNENQDLVYCQPEICSYLGYKQDELQEKLTGEWLHFDGAEIVLTKKTKETIRTKFLKKEIEKTPGKRWQLILLSERLESNRHRLMKVFAETFMKDVNLGVLLINKEYELIDISDMACRILGINRDVMLGKSMDHVFSSVPKEHRLVQRTLLDGLVVRNHAFSWMNNDERFELLMDSSLLTDEDGDTVGAYIIFKDVSNLRSLEEQVQRSDRLAMIGQIAAGTAHEIRNPLTSIKGFLQVLRKTLTERDLEKEQGYIEIMLTEINRINGLVSEFLLLSKPKDSVYNKVNISNVVTEILPIINNEAILHNVNIKYDACPGLPEVVADRELLKQVFLNICKNGIEAMGSGGTLSVHEGVNSGQKQINIDIHDTGPGIPSFLIDKIFDPFFTTKEEGIGLGLSVCQRIIHDMGGTIQVRSKGFGTTFRISLPQIT